MKKLYRITLIITVTLIGFSHSYAQSKASVGGLGKSVVDFKLTEITLESINFQNQTAELNLGLEVSNRLIPITLKDFDYAISLFDRQLIEGTHLGNLKINRQSRVNLPVRVHIRSIPDIVWSAFRNRGNINYKMDTGFTLPLFVMERRFDQSFSGEVPLRSLVDAATILRAARGSSGSILGW